MLMSKKSLTTIILDSIYKASEESNSKPSLHCSVNQSPEAVPLQGVSNTPCITTKDKEQMMCLRDYLYFRLPCECNPFNDMLQELFRILKVVPERLEKKWAQSGGTLFQFEDYFTLIGSTEKTQTGDTAECCWIELKGEGCREFERRNSPTDEAWLELLEFVADNATKVNRRDFTRDVFFAFPINEFIKRLKDRDYCTRFRQINIETSESTLIDVPPGEFNEIDYSLTTGAKNKGRTVTIGTRGSNSLVVYDKYAEQKAKKRYSLAGISHWWRVELRLSDKKAMASLKKEITYLRSGMSFEEFSCSIIWGALDIKEPSRHVVKNKYLAHTWPLWAEILSPCKERFKLTVPQRTRLKLEQKPQWLKVQTKASLLQLYLTNPEEFYNFLGEVLFSGSEKLDNNFLAEINSLRRANDLKPLSAKEAKTLCKSDLLRFKEGSALWNKYLEKEDISIPDVKETQTGDGEVVDYIVSKTKKKGGEEE